MSGRTLTLKGSPYEFGFTHGTAFRELIRSYAKERLRLAGEPDWTGGRRSSRERVLELAEACVEHHHAFSPALFEELEGLSAATDLTLAELIVVGGFTDFIDTVAATSAADAQPLGINECTAFLVPGARMADGAGAFAQTWDMHEGSSESLVLLRGFPDGAPAFEALTTAGAVGMIGMNEAGLVVGINNLMGADGRPGVTWPFVVREMLTKETLEDALEVLSRAHLAGGHNYLVMDATGAGANVEAMATVSHTTPLAAEPIVHTNHCLASATQAVERPRDRSSQQDSEARLKDAENLLGGTGLTPQELMDITAHTNNICKVGVAPRFVGTCGAVVAKPATREFWVSFGRPSEEPFERSVVGGAVTGGGR